MQTSATLAAAALASLIAGDLAYGQQTSADQFMTPLKAKAAAECRDKSDNGIQDCYEKALRAYGNHPGNLEVHDAVAFCIHSAAPNNDSFCSNLWANQTQLFDEEPHTRHLEADREAAREAAREARDRQWVAEEAVKSPSLLPVTANSIFTYLPGAVVCSDQDTVSLMVDLYRMHSEQEFQNRITNGRWRLMHGEPASEPDPTNYGCALLKPGTPMILDGHLGISVVTAHLENGKTVRGVTWPQMMVDASGHVPWGGRQ